jgi:MarR family transcriptional regulator, 2-MHQ and catechol-resistance regulon repressor
MPTHYQGSRRDTAALNAYINLVRASETVLSRMSSDLDEKGLTLGQFGVLEALLHLGPMHQGELGRKLLRSGGDVTYVINNLERKGWVRRERVVQDQRRILIRLTPRGRILIEQEFPAHLKAIRREFGRLSLKEQESLRRLCRNLGRGRPAAAISARNSNRLAKRKGENKHAPSETK